MPDKKATLQIEDVALTVSNLDKVFYPSSGFTKGQVIDYYIRIAPALLPHLSGRPITLKRYPDGALADYFYQKECPSHRPEWVPTVPIWSASNNKNTNYCLIEDIPSLVWAANLAALELHTSLSLAANMPSPTMVVFDLDPGHPATIIECTEVALLLRTIFENHQLASYPKTSGSKGLQVYVPLNTPTDYYKTKSFAYQLAQILEAQHPQLVVSNMKKVLRKGKVFVDWSQNDEHKTTVCVYSLRARPEPTVSAPVSWQEVERAWQTKDPSILTLTASMVLERFEKYGDIFEPLLTQKQKLPEIDVK
ncbi:MAG: non-homologous end-joining DNA ligase [Negativicutes bacterium]|nr:non-homologous end-joining DNA ligase [Negativicutes bacterium]